METNKIVHKLQIKINHSSYDLIQHSLAGGYPYSHTQGVSHNGRSRLPFHSSKKKKKKKINHAILPNLHGNPSSVE